MTNFIYSLLLLIYLISSDLEPSCGNDGGLADNASSQPVKTVNNEEKVRAFQTRVRLASVAQAFEQGMFRLGNSDVCYASAFVISREHRLLATSAHVADNLQYTGFLEAIQNGTTLTYRVERVWYHPAIKRNLDDDLSVRSPEVIDGHITTPGPDVAVVQLGVEGPILSTEWKLASLDEIHNLRGLTIGTLRLPLNYDCSTIKATHALLESGPVIALDGYKNDEQFVGTTALVTEGTSGSPFFLESGAVVAIACSEITKGPQLSSQGIRIDCLWELLFYHNLQDKVSQSVDRERVAEFTEPVLDPKIHDFRRAVQLVQEAKHYTSLGEYRQAGECCNQAIRLVPRYGSAYMQRGRIRMFYCQRNWKRLSDTVKEEQLGWALRDLKTAQDPHPYLVNDTIFLIPQLCIYIGVVERDEKWFERTLDDANHLLTMNYLEASDRALAFNLRGQAREFLNDPSGSRTDYDESSRLSTKNPNVHWNRSVFWERQRHPIRSKGDKGMCPPITNKSNTHGEFRRGYCPLSWMRIFGRRGFASLRPRCKYRRSPLSQR
jgi:hypothetical protein